MGRKRKVDQEKKVVVSISVQKKLLDDVKKYLGKDGNFSELVNELLEKWNKSD